MLLTLADRRPRCAPAARVGCAAGWCHDADAWLRPGLVRSDRSLWRPRARRPRPGRWRWLSRWARRQERWRTPSAWGDRVWSRASFSLSGGGAGYRRGPRADRRGSGDDEGV